MKLGSLNGFDVRIPETGGKAGKGRALTGSVQVLRDNVIVKQFRFEWLKPGDGTRAVRAAKAFCNSQGCTE